MQNILDGARAEATTLFVALIDPDHFRLEKVASIIENAEKTGVDLIFIGGSLVLNDRLDACLSDFKKATDIPLVLFPGSTYQVNPTADAILFLTLISGRNPDLLIGNHVIAAPYIKKAGLEALPTGYMLIDGGKKTAVQYISNTNPIPHDKPDIAACTAMAGEMLGLRNIYMDAGSGALNPVSPEMIQYVSKSVDKPVIVGGGLKTPEEVAIRAQAGATAIVVGNAIEQDPGLVREMAAAVKGTKKVSL